MHSFIPCMKKSPSLSNCVRLSCFHPSAAPALVLDWECVVPPEGFVAGELLVLLGYVSALAVDIDRHEGEVALHAPSRCIVNFEPKTVAAGRAGHTAESGSFAGQHSRVPDQRNLKGDSPTGGAERGNVLLVQRGKVRPLHTGSRRATVELRYQPFFFGPCPNTAIHVGHGGGPLHYTCRRHRVASYCMY